MFFNKKKCLARHADIPVKFFYNCNCFFLRQQNIYINDRSFDFSNNQTTITHTHSNSTKTTFDDKRRDFTFGLANN